MAIQLHHDRETRPAREKQLQSGATHFTHIRPVQKHTPRARVGSEARFRHGYRKSHNPFFGPVLRVTNSRIISDLLELLDSEIRDLPPGYSSRMNLKGCAWTRGPKLEVIVLDVLSNGRED